MPGPKPKRIEVNPFTGRILIFLFLKNPENDMDKDTEESENQNGYGQFFKNRGL